MLPSPWPGNVGAGTVYFTAAPSSRKRTFCSTTAMATVRSSQQIDEAQEAETSGRFHSSHSVGSMVHIPVVFDVSFGYGPLLA
jgi:hypothetical protein